MKTFYTLLFSFITLSTLAQKSLPYTLNQPDVVYELPPILNEVSGLTNLDSAHVACVQDELGIVFIYNFLTDSIVGEYRFDSIGDFEGLTHTEESLYVLRSDGLLLELEGFDFIHGSKAKHLHYLQLLTSNNEGLCYDSEHGRLLIAAKNKPYNPEDKNERYIYSFDLKSRSLSEEPYFVFYLDSLEKRLPDFGIIQQEISPKGKPKPFNFRPASLSVHPSSDLIYVLSASDRLMVIINRSGEVVHMEKLDEGLYPKAEGITFLEDGTMIITNEYAGGKPTLLVFKQKI